MSYFLIVILHSVVEGGGEVRDKKLLYFFIVILYLMVEGGGEGREG